MRAPLIATVATALAVALAGCDNADRTDATNADAPAAEAAGGATIADQLGEGTATFARAAEASGLDETLDGPGPYTVLVPLDGAFAKLPAGALDTLLKPESRPQLTKVLTAHILSGAVLAGDIAKAIDNGGGKTQLMTIGGGQLTATKDGDKIVLTDSAGGKAVIAHADEKRSNGVIHHVDTVLTPS
jgi:uncharacterized surface protein with fasciclin (FAS1) repeats